MKIFFDYETRSFCDLKSSGGWKYSEHPSTDIICMAYAVDDGAVKHWLPGQPVPKEFLKADSFVARNVFFEYAITVNVAIPKYDFPERMKQTELYECTAALSRMHGLPASLEPSADYLNKKFKKLPDGKRLIQLYSLPVKDRKTGALSFRPIPPDELKRWLDYNVLDVEADRETYKILSKLPNVEIERGVFLHDFNMNVKGVRIDTKALEKLLSVVETATERALAGPKSFSVEWVDKEGNKKTAPLNVRSPQKLKIWLAAQGIEIDDCRIDTIEETYDEAAAREMEDVKKVLAWRMFLAKASVKKFRAAFDRVSPDGRLRYFLKYYGAHTGRFSGEGFQIHNLPKAKWADGVDPVKEIDRMIKEITADLPYMQIVDWSKKILPGLIIPNKGNVFLSGDFAAVEARGIAWLAGCEKLLSQFRTGADIYVDMAKNINAAKPNRQLGKAVILGCLAVGTNVLTKTDGWKTIETVTEKDLLWDGDKWVKNGGIQARGLKSVILIGSRNIYVTPDHWILSPNGWQTAVEIDFVEDTKPPRSAQKTPDAKLSPQNFTAARSAVSVCGAYAELKKKSALINFGAVKTYFAHVAPNHIMDSVGETLTDAQISWLIQNLESVGMLVSSISKKDVAALVRKTSTGTAVAELNAASHPLEIFWNTLLRCAGLISGDSRWIELIITGTMNPETYELLAKKKIIKTVETYDIVNVGERNCFLTSGGIVHNCGYGMGEDKFYSTCLKWGIDVPKNVAALAVKKYRTTYPEIPRFWYALEDAFRKTWLTKKAHTVGRIVFERGGNYIRVKLPSGRYLFYHRVEISDGSISYMNFGKKGARIKIWGGVLAENITQAMCRDILVNRVLECEKAGLPVRLHVHDEDVTEVPEKKAKQAQKVFDKILNTAPLWAKGFPLKTESEIKRRYTK